MFTICLIGEEEVQILPHHPSGIIHQGGDSWGNGSIDWNPDGVFLWEVIEASHVQQKMAVLAALCGGKLLMLDSFITENCAVQLVRSGDAIGQALVAQYVGVLVNAAVRQVKPAYEVLPSDIDFQYAYGIPQMEQLDDDALACIQRKLDDFLREPPTVRKHLKNSYDVAKQFAEQGQRSLAMTVLTREIEDPTTVYEMEEYLQLANENQFVIPKNIAEIKIVSQELRTVKEISVLLPRVIVTYLSA